MKSRICANCGLTFAAHGPNGICPETEGGDFVEGSSSFEDSGDSYEVPAGQRALPRKRVLELLSRTETSLQEWFEERLRDDLDNMDLDECRQALLELWTSEFVLGDAWLRMAEALEDCTPEELLLPEPEPEPVIALTLTRSCRPVQFWEIEVGQLFWARGCFWSRLDGSAAKQVGGTISSFDEDEAVEPAEVHS